MKQLEAVALISILGSVCVGATASPAAQTASVTTPRVGANGAAWVPSPNFNARTPAAVPIDVVVLHSTCTSTNETAETVRLFQSAASKVSSHYVVGKDGTVVQMVSEADRAWHAGVCRWRGRTDVNSCSIGIEMVHRDQDPNDTWPDAQIAAVARLLLDIRRRQRVPNDQVIFHSECAYPPGRKTDPVGFDRPRLLQAVLRLVLIEERPPAPNSGGSQRRVSPAGPVGWPLWHGSRDSREAVLLLPQNWGPSHRGFHCGGSVVIGRRAGSFTWLALPTLLTFLGDFAIIWVSASKQTTHRHFLISHGRCDP